MTDLLRPDLVSRTPLRLWLAATLSGAITGGLLAAALLPSSPPSATTIVAEPTVSLVPTPPTMIVMKTDAPVPPAPPPPAPEAPAPAPIRAAAPWLDAACILPVADTGPDACAPWDTGFPAISRDGTTVAVLVSDDDGGRGNPNARVELIDVATSKVARTYKLLDADEYELGNEKLVAKLVPVVERRTKTAQKALAGYRSMSLVPVIDRARHAESSDEPLVIPTSRYAEIEGDRMRLVDPATARSTWTATIATESPTDAPDEVCGAWYRLDAALAIDEATGVALVSQEMRTGGCMCPDLSVRTIERVPR